MMYSYLEAHAVNIPSNCLCRQTSNFRTSFERFFERSLKQFLERESKVARDDLNFVEVDLGQLVLALFYSLIEQKTFRPPSYNTVIYSIPEGFTKQHRAQKLSSLFRRKTMI